MPLPKTFVFVLMPFDESFNDIYTYGIKQTCIDLNAYCERVDEQIFSEGILDRIYNQISKSDVIVADMTNRNANVFYEVGYAHGLGKNVILLTKNSEDIPFDLKHFPHIIYNGQIKLLSEQLKRKLEWFITQEEAIERASIDFGLEFLTNGGKIEDGKSFQINHKDKDIWEPSFKIKVDIFNNSSKIFSSKFNFGFEISESFEGVINGLELIKPSPQTVLYVSKDFSNIYPNAFKSLTFNLNDIKKEGAEAILEIKLKVFTAFEMKETKFSLIFTEVTPFEW